MLRKSVLTVFALLGVAGLASADPLLLPANEPVYFQFNNLEVVDPNNGLVVPEYEPATGTQGNWGVFNISSIQNGGVLPGNEHTDIGGGDGFFFNDGPGGTFGQVTGIFYGIDFTGATTANGGFMDLYWQEPGSDPITTDCMSGNACLPDANTVNLFTGGTFLARLYFDTGIITGDNDTTISSNVNPTLGVSGQADAFASVDTTVVGAWTSLLDGNWFWVDTDGDGIFGEADELRDIRFSTFFNATADHWDVAGPNTGLRSNDPGRVFTAAPVPEPATLALFGVGLAFIAGAARRRLKK